MTDRKLITLGKSYQRWENIQIHYRMVEFRCTKLINICPTLRDRVARCPFPRTTPSLPPARGGERTAGGRGGDGGGEAAGDGRLHERPHLRRRHFGSLAGRRREHRPVGSLDTSTGVATVIRAGDGAGATAGLVSARGVSGRVQPCPSSSLGVRSLRGGTWPRGCANQQCHD